MNCVLFCLSILPFRCVLSAETPNTAEVISVGASTDLEAALRNDAGFPSTTVHLLRNDANFQISSPVTVENELVIQGNQQTILIDELVSIQQFAFLSIVDLTLRTNQRSGGLKQVVEVIGRVYVQGCSFEGFHIAAFALIGTLEIRSGDFSRSDAPAIVIGSGGARLQLMELSVFRHAGAFLSAQFSSGNSTLTTIEISDCSFRNSLSKDGEYLFKIVNKRFAGIFTVSNSLFNNNLLPLFYFDISSFSVKFDTVDFYSNEETVFTVYGNDVLFDVASTIWRLSGQLVFDVHNFQGEITVSNSSITEQTRTGPIRIDNNLQEQTCSFSLIDSSITEIQLKVDYETPGVLQSSSCQVFMSNSTIRNVKVETVKFADLRSLIWIQYGLFALVDVGLENSGSSGAVIVTIGSNLSMRNVVLNNPLSGENLYIGGTLTTASLSNVTIIDGDRIAVGRQFTGVEDPLYLTFVASKVSLVRIAFLRNRKEDLAGSFIALGFSEFVVTGVLLQGLRTFCFAGFSSSFGEVSDIHIQTCIFNKFIFQLLHQSEVRVRNLWIEDVVVVSKGVLCLSRNSDVHAEDLILRNVTGTMFVYSKKSQFNAKNAIVTHCSFDYLIHYPLSSYVSFENLDYSHSRGGVTFGINSEISLSDSRINAVSSNYFLFGGRNSTITLERVTITDAFSHFSLIKMNEQSSLSLQNTLFNHFGSLEGEGFVFQDCNVSVFGCFLSSFNVSLIQGTFTDFIISNSTFRDGRNPTQSMKSKAAFGGVIGCVDCSIVHISHITVFNVSSEVGGAVSARRLKSGNWMELTVNNSEFFMCKAYVGGAVFIQDVTFRIQRTTFISNSAESTGGAIDINIKTDYSGVVENCSFIRNSAIEGGGIKWKNAEISLISVIFHENIASYGPSVASYGIRLSSSLAPLSPAESSGSHLTLIFTLLDHYRFIVQTASNKVLQLISTPIVTYRGNEAAIINKGVFNFSQLTIYAPPNSTQTIAAVMQDTIDDRKITLRGEVVVTFRGCVLGEIMGNDRCERCYPGNVSYSIHDANCNFCPPHAFCPGGYLLLVDPHYWRSAWNSTSILRCPLEDKCLGGPESTCAPGYTGVLCYQCAPGYYRFRSIECAKCHSAAAIWSQILALLACLSLFVYSVLRFAVIQPNAAKLFVLKSLLHHCQMLTAMCPLKLSLPEMIKNTLHGVTYFSSLLVMDFPLECVGVSSQEIARAVLGSVLFPALTLVFLLPSALFSHSWKRSTAVFATSTLLFTSVITVNSIIPLLVCPMIDSDIRLLYVDISEQCWEGTHLRLVYFLVIPSLMGNVALPLGAAAVLAGCYPDTFDEYFPLWKSGYKKRYWDFVLLMAKCVLFTLLISAISAHKLTQLSYGLIVLIITCVVNVSFCESVFLSPKVFYLSEASIFISTVSMGLAGFYVYYNPIDGATDYFLSLLFLLLNIGFFAMCAYLLVAPGDLLLNKIAVDAHIGSQERISVPNNSIVELQSGISSESVS